MKHLGLLIFLLAGVGMAQTGFSIDAIDRNVQACSDFYGFACGNWVKNNPIPAEYGRWGRFAELNERNFSTLKDILETSAAKKTRSAVEQKIGDYYSSCMDDKGIEARGTAPLKSWLDRISGLKEKSEVPALLGELHTVGVNAFFATGAGPDYKNSKMNIAQAAEGGLGLPDRDYYLKTDAKSEEIRKAYVAHVAKMFELSGYSSEAASAAAKVVMDIETTLAKATMDRVARRNPLNRYHPMGPEQFAALTPSFRWEDYARALKTRRVESVNVSNPDFFKAFDKMYSTTSLDDIKPYLAWHMIALAASTLPQGFVEENFAFYGRTLTGAKELRPRWKRCIDAVDSDLAEALGQKYVEQTFGADAKKRMAEMIANLTEALRKDIGSLDWMTEATKKKALEKLTAIQNKVGYPDKWLNYSTLEIKPEDAFGNSLRSNAFQKRRQLDKIGKPVDPTEWRMSPPTVNAYYSPLENNINFPAGILQPPFFDVKMDDAVNYGGIGAVIGHEITHGFDDSGRRFDGSGNLNDWWTPEDGKEYEKRAACVDEQYSGYTAVADVRLNGKLTLGENVADNGGLRIAYMALEDALEGKSPAKIDGFTPEQRFFLGWAQVWCQNITEEDARLRAQTDPHSPGRYRVNGTVSNMPEFWKAYGCKEGQPMVRGSNACRVW